MFAAGVGHPLSLQAVRRIGTHIRANGSIIGGLGELQENTMAPSPAMSSSHLQSDRLGCGFARISHRDLRNLESALQPAHLS
jgi:hypothetical protein